MPDRPTGGGALSRRSLLSGALAAGLLGAGTLSACGGPIAGSTSRLAFWHLMSGGDGIRMDEILSSMAADGAGTPVKQTVLSWGTPYYTKLAMSSAGGRAPDMAIMHLSRLAGYAPGGLLDPWDISRFEKYGVSADTFAGAIYDRMHVGEDLFAISLDSHAFIRFFNSEIADAAGVLDSDGKLLPTATVDEFIEQAVAMQGVTGDLGLSWGWLGDSSHIWRFFWTLYTQQGASMSVEDGALQYEPDAFMKALETMIALISSPAAYRRSDESGKVVVTQTWQPLAVEPGTPVVYALTPSANPRDCSIVVDDQAVGRVAGEHFLRMGRTRIAHITGPERFDAARERLTGLQQALAAGGTELVAPAYFGGWGEDWGRQATQMLLRAHPDVDAIYCGSDLLARGVTDSLREGGRNVPHDIAVIGTDNWEIIATGARPPLTTVDTSLTEVGRLAAERLLDAIAGRPHSGIEPVPPRLVLRASTDDSAT